MKRRDIFKAPLALATASLAEAAFARPDPNMIPGLRARSAHGEAQSRHHQTTPKDYRNVTVSCGSALGTIRSLQGVNGTPLGIMPGFPDLYGQFEQLRVDFVRMHDIFGPGEIDSAFVNTDTYNATCLGVSGQAGQNAVVAYANPRVIFPDPTADPKLPHSYNFAATDAYIQSIIDIGAKVFFRVGRSQSAGSVPPTDLPKYGEIVKHIVMHYNQGWAKGYINRVKHWEIGNEPDLGSANWSGTPQQYYDLYSTVSKAVKSVDPTSLVGGPALTFAQNTNTSDGNAYEEQLIKWAAQNNMPMDFFSYHCYPNDTKSFDPYDFFRLGKIVRDLLDNYGFSKARVMITEWNLSPSASTDTPYVQNIQNAAFVGAALTYMQDSAIDASFFYRGDAAYLGLFEKDGKFSDTALAFEMMGAMQKTPYRVSTSGADTIGFAVLAGISNDQKTVQILVSNYQRDVDFLSSTLSNTPTEASLNITTDPNGALNRRYFGGVSPSTVKNTNDSHTGGIVVDLPTYTVLTPQDYDYSNNSGVSLVVDSLPWGKAAFSATRYELSASRKFEVVEQTTSKGGKYEVNVALAPPSLELIVLKLN